MDRVGCTCDSDNVPEPLCVALAVGVGGIKVKVDEGDPVTLGGPGMESVWVGRKDPVPTGTTVVVGPKEQVRDGGLECVSVNSSVGEVIVCVGLGIKVAVVVTELPVPVELGLPVGDGDDDPDRVQVVVGRWVDDLVEDPLPGDIVHVSVSLRVG